MERASPGGPNLFPRGECAGGTATTYIWLLRGRNARAPTFLLRDLRCAPALAFSRAQKLPPTPLEDPFSPVSAAKPSDQPSAWQELRLLLRARDWGFLGVFTGFLTLGGILEVLSLASIPLFLSLFIPADQGTRAANLFRDALRSLGASSETAQLWLGAVALLVGNLLRTAWSIWGTAIQYRFQARRRRDFSGRLLTAYLRAPAEFREARGSANLLNQVVVECDNVVLGTLCPLMEFLRGGITCFFVILLLLCWTPLMTLVALLLLGGTASALLFFRNSRLKKLAQQEQSGRATAMEQCSQALSGSLEAAIYGKRRGFLESFSRAMTGLSNAQGASMLQIRSTWPALEFLSILILMAVSLAALAFQHGDVLRVGPQIALLAMSLVRLRSCSVFLMQSALEFRRFRPSLVQVCRDLRELEGLQNAFPSLESEESAKALGLKKELSATDLSFTYPGQDAPALALPELVIHRGESLAIVGHTGCGKSTLLALLLGLRTPQKGRVAIDGVALTPLNRAAWWHTLSYVPQRPFLLAGTARANIALAEGALSEDQERALKESLLLCQLDPSGLPEGLETRVGADGQGLSGGQAQRLVLARALFHHREVLFLDEATSALDPRTQELLQQALKALHGKITLVAVTHRLETLSNYDRVLFLEDGRPVALGSYDELLQRSPEFRLFATRKGAP